MSMSVGTASGATFCDINTTPLIDVMLVLLVTLIVTLPVMTHAVKLDMPQANNPPPPNRPEVIDLEIARHQLHVAVLVETASVGAGGELGRGDAADFEDAGLHDFPLHRTIPRVRREVAGRPIKVARLLVRAPVHRLGAEVVRLGQKRVTPVRRL